MTRHKSQPGIRDSQGRKIPKKYLHGLSKKKRGEMKKEIKDFRDKPDDYSPAYKPWTADRGAKPKKKSKATKAYHRMFGTKTEDEERDGKWDITHKDLSGGRMLLIKHSTGERRTLPKTTSARMRLKLKKLDAQWEKGRGSRRYPNVHKHIDAVLEPFFS